jgi:hypothetical protein
MTSTEELAGADDGVITQHLMAKYGPMLGRLALAEVLQFPSAEAFDRHCQRGHLEMPVMKFPGRRGVFVLATDVARYLVRSSRGGQ